MKRNILVMAGIALILAVSLSDLRSQNDAPAPAAAPPTNQLAAPGNPSKNIPVSFAADPANPAASPAPGGTNQPLIQRLPPARFRQGHPVFARAISDLRAVKMELQRTQGDLAGHKDSAMEACDKAMQELTEVLKALPPPPSPQRPAPPPPGAAHPSAPPGTTPAPAAQPAQPPQ